MLTKNDVTKMVPIEFEETQLMQQTTPRVISRNTNQQIRGIFVARRE